MSLRGGLLLGVTLASLFQSMAAATDKTNNSDQQGSEYWHGDYALSANVPVKDQAGVRKAERVVQAVRRLQLDKRTGRIDERRFRAGIADSRREAAQIASANPDSPYVLNSAARACLQAAHGIKSRYGPDEQAAHEQGLAWAKRAAELARSGGDKEAELLALRTLGHGHYAAGEYPQARELARELLKRNPKDPVGISLWEHVAGRDRPPDAGSDGDPRPPAARGGAFAAGPRPGMTPEASAAYYAGLNARFDAAEEALARGAWAEAKARADGILEREPDVPRALWIRLTAHQNLKDYGGATVDATRGLAAAERLAASGGLSAEDRDWWREGFYARRARALNAQERWREALADADAALRLDPRDAAAWLQRGTARRALHGEAAWREDFGRAAALRPELRAAYEESPAGRPGTAMGGIRPAQVAAPPADTPTPAPYLSAEAAAAAAALLLLAGALARRFVRGGTAPAAPGAPAPRPAVEPDPYELDRSRLLGEGGMGKVYEGYDRALARKVAIKELREEIQSHEAERERFLREARTVAALDHPNIVRIYAVVRERDRTLLVFEFVEGGTLARLLRDAPAGRLGLKETLGIARQACAALDYAHGRRVLHRDLKPSNIMVTSEGAVRVMDFGIARTAKDSLSRLDRTNTVAGTPPYMAPELEDGLVGPGCDVYALGVTLYETLTGRLPFAASSACEARRLKLRAEFEPPSGIVAGLPPALDAVFARALHPDAKSRPAAPGRLLDELVLALERPAEFSGGFDAVGPVVP